MTEVDETNGEIEALSALIDDELSAEEERELRSALVGDADLRARLEQFESVDAALRDLEAPPMSADLLERIQAAIEVGTDEAGQPRETTGASGANWRWPLAAALAAALFAGWLAFPGDEAPIELAAPATPVAPAEPEVEPEASDVELAIAFELETLRDFEVIEELELLEALLALEEEQGSSGEAS